MMGAQQSNQMVAQNQNGGYSSQALQNAVGAGQSLRDTFAAHLPAGGNERVEVFPAWNVDFIGKAGQVSTVGLPRERALRIQALSAVQGWITDELARLLKDAGEK